MRWFSFLRWPRSWRWAVVQLASGREVRRRSWRAGVRLRRSSASRFIIVANPETFWLKVWSPYLDDFDALDWEVIGAPNS